MCLSKLLSKKTGFNIGTMVERRGYGDGIGANTVYVTMSTISNFINHKSLIKFKNNKVINSYLNF